MLVSVSSAFSFHLLPPSDFLHVVHGPRFHLGVNVFLFILSEIWLANFGKTLTYNNNDSILFQKPRVSWVVALICPMPGCSLLKLLVLGICVLRLLQPAPCKMILLCCMSLGELPQACL